LPLRELPHSEPGSVYFARTGELLSSHLLKEFSESPAKYRAKVLSDEDIDRPAYVIGRALHTHVLEPGEFDPIYQVGGPVNPKTGKEYGVDTKKWEEACEEAKRDGKELLARRDYEMILSMDTSIHTHQDASFLLSRGLAEQVSRAEIAGVACQARVDWITTVRHDAGLTDCVTICDLKSCGDLGYFDADLITYRYREQLAFYSLVLKACGFASRIEGFLIGCEKQKPYRCGVWHITESVMQDYENRQLMEIEKLAQCQKQNVWPTGYEQTRYCS